MRFKNKKRLCAEEPIPLYIWVVLSDREANLKTLATQLFTLAIDCAYRDFDWFRRAKYIVQRLIVSLCISWSYIRVKPLRNANNYRSGLIGYGSRK